MRCRMPGLRSPPLGTAGTSCEPTATFVVVEGVHVRLSACCCGCRTVDTRSAFVFASPIELKAEPNDAMHPQCGQLCARRETTPLQSGQWVRGDEPDACSEPTGCGGIAGMGVDCTVISAARTSGKDVAGSGYLRRTRESAVSGLPQLLHNGAGLRSVIGFI